MSTPRARTRRREAAILFADVEGFTRMMEADERATLRVLRRYGQSVIGPQVTAAGGRVVKTLGDGFIALLPTAQQAVACALAVQRQVDRRNARLPGSRRLLFRIGINLATVVETADGDVWGHGINLAARLQTLAPPGGIVVSQSVCDAVGPDVATTLFDEGLHRLKNVHEPVRVFRIGTPSRAPFPRRPGSRRRKAGDRADGDTNPGDPAARAPWPAPSCTRAACV